MPIKIDRIDARQYFLDGQLLDLKEIKLINTLFVDPEGDDSTAVTGTFNRPYKTIDAAVSNASPGDTIIIYPGDYTTTATISKPGINIWCFPGVIIRPEVTPFFNATVGVEPFKFKGHASFIAEFTTFQRFIFNFYQDMDIECDDITIDSSAAGGNGIETGADSILRLKSKSYTFLGGVSGSGANGMRFNPNLKRLDIEIENAWIRTNGVDSTGVGVWVRQFGTSEYINITLRKYRYEKLNDLNEFDGPFQIQNNPNTPVKFTSDITDETASGITSVATIWVTQGCDLEFNGKINSLYNRKSINFSGGGTQKIKISGEIIANNQTSVTIGETNSSSRIIFDNCRIVNNPTSDIGSGVTYPTVLIQNSNLVEFKNTDIVNLHNDSLEANGISMASTSIFGPHVFNNTKIIAPDYSISNKTGNPLDITVLSLYTNTPFEGTINNLVTGTTVVTDSNII